MIVEAAKGTENSLHSSHIGRNSNFSTRMETQSTEIEARARRKNITPGKIELALYNAIH